MIKQRNGYSLGVLVITIAVMIILTTTVLMSFNGMSEEKAITNFMNDLAEVEEYVKEYYGEKRVLPIQYDDNNLPIGITEEQYEKIKPQISENDMGNYYLVDLDKLERIHLKDKERGYLLNESSLNIYVTTPIKYQDVNYYTITDDLEGNDKTYNDDADFEMIISGNPINWVNRASLILSIPDLEDEAAGSELGKNWTFKYYDQGPITADEFVFKGKLFLYGEIIEIAQNGIVSIYAENPEGHSKIVNVIITKIDEIDPKITLNGDNKTSGKLTILDEETGINPDQLLYKIIGYDTVLDNSENARDILFYGTRYTKYIEKYNSLKTSYDDLENRIEELANLGSGDSELAGFENRLKNIEEEINELNNDNRDFNDGKVPYSDEEPNIAIYVEDYAGNTAKYIDGISRNVLLNSNLIDYEAKPLKNSTFGIVKTSEYTNANKLNLRIRSLGATHMLITTDSTISPTSLSNYKPYESSNGDYELDISEFKEGKITIYAYFTAGETQNGNLIYNAFSDVIYVDKEAPTNDAPTLKVSNNLDLEITVNQQDEGSGLSEIEYGISQSEAISSYTWSTDVNSLEKILVAGEKYYFRTRVSDTLGNGPTTSEAVVFLCPEKKVASTPNVPVLGNMKAITWDSNKKEIEIDSETLKDDNGVTRVWYNYVAGNGVNDEGTSKWANAKTTNNSYFVWIPRYAYRVVYYTDGTKTEIKGYYQKSPITGNIGYFENDGQTLSTEAKVKSGYGDIDVVFLYGTEDYRYLDIETNQLKSLIKGDEEIHSRYIVHPAFQQASVGANNLGTWNNKGLTGIWVAKYEASREDATYSEEGTLDAIKSVHHVRSLDDVSISKAYDLCASFNPTMNSHLMKNSEWGAVVYLAYSVYGRNGNTISQNLASDMITGGCSTSSGANYSSTTEGKFAGSFGYATPSGFSASTTKNIYGVYDLVGGVEEYVAAYINNTQLNSEYTGSLQTASAGYYQVYTKASSDTSTNNYSANASIYGDAIYEISTSATTTWEENSMSYPAGSTPIFTRGGSYSDDAGMFNLNKTDGSAKEKVGFRPVLVP